MGLFAITLGFRQYPCTPLMDMYLNFPDVIYMCIILAARHQQQAHDASHPVSSTVSSGATLRYVDFVYLITRAL